MAEPQSVYVTSPSASSELVNRLARLDAVAWQELFEEYFVKMRNFAYARTGDLTLAEDIASEVFAAAVKGIASYRDKGAPIGAWLYRIARNITADNVERRKRRPSVPIEALQIEAPSALTRVDEHSDLVSGLVHLTREQQEVISLRFYGECSLEETAQAMGKSTGAVKVLQHRALVALRRHLHDKDVGQGR